MSVLWGEAKPGRAEHALSGIEVDEVSLVDRPATGKRFVLFKRRGTLRRREEDANIRSEADGAGTAEPAAMEDRLRALDSLEKRAEAASGELERLQTVAAGLERRLAAVEKGSPVRQSAEPAAPASRLWAGIL